MRERGEFCVCCAVSFATRENFERKNSACCGARWFSFGRKPERFVHDDAVQIDKVARLFGGGREDGGLAEEADPSARCVKSKGLRGQGRSWRPPSSKRGGEAGKQAKWGGARVRAAA